MISADTTIAALLEEHPQLLDFLAGYHGHFEKLRDPGLRGVMAPRVTIEQAAQIAGMKPGDLIAALRRAVGAPGARETVPAQPTLDAPSAAPPAPHGGAEVPAGLRRVELDVRDDIRQGREPLMRIMTALKTLGPDEALVMRAPFEPIPLYDVAGKRGFAHATERRAPDDWVVTFHRAAPEAPVGPPVSQPATPTPRTTTIDVRELEPPLPMVRVLELLDELAPDDRLEVIHDRRPMFLYPQLEERGFVHATDEPGPGLVRIVIRRGPA